MTPKCIYLTTSLPLFLTPMPVPFDSILAALTE